FWPTAFITDFISRARIGNRHLFHLFVNICHSSSLLSISFATSPACLERSLTSTPLTYRPNASVVGSICPRRNLLAARPMAHSITESVYLCAQKMSCSLVGFGASGMAKSQNLTICSVRSNVFIRPPRPNYAPHILDTSKHYL